MLISMSPNGGKKLERNGPHMLVKPDTESQVGYEGNDEICFYQVFFLLTHTQL